MNLQDPDILSGEKGLPLHQQETKHAELTLKFWDS